MSVVGVVVWGDDNLKIVLNVKFFSSQVCGGELRTARRLPGEVVISARANEGRNRKYIPYSKEHTSSRNHLVLLVDVSISCPLARVRSCSRDKLVSTTS